jgi:LacI family transcriptional regulator
MAYEVFLSTAGVLFYYLFGQINILDMSKKIRIKDVAQKAKVSQGTVDRVIHDRGRVNPEVKKKVLKVMEELGFERNLIASALAKNQTFRFGVLLPDPNTDPYWAEPYKGIKKAAQLVRHYGVVTEMYYFELESSDSFSKEAKKMLKQPLDALLFPPLFLKEGKWLLEACKKRGIPNVMINTNIENTDSLCYIGQNSYQSGVLAARLLHVSNQENEIFLILNLTTGTTNAVHLMQKAQGFKDYFKQNDIQKVSFVVEEFSDFSNKRKLREFLKKIEREYPELSGIFFTNSRAYYAVNCMEGTYWEKVKIAGFDLVEPNIQLLHQNKIHFLINQNPFEQGYLGITHLHQHLILKEAIPNIVYLPLDIVVKENVQYYLERNQHVHMV